MRLRLIGVPSSAGAHAPGVERAPGQLRAAGLAEALSAAGIAVFDAGDLPVSLFAATAPPSGARNLAAVLKVVSHVADAVAAARADGDVPVLLGGDCTLVLCAVAGLRRHEQARGEVGVFYLDGDADLDTPQEGWGVLDSCGVAHLLGDGDPQLAALRPDGPLLDAASLVLFGFHPAQLSAGQWRRFAGRGLYGVPVTAIPPETPDDTPWRLWPGCGISQRCCATSTSTPSTTRASRSPIARATTVACPCQTPSTPSKPSLGTPGWPA
jgi:arginase